MPAGGFRTFVAGENLDETKINDYLMQGILVFGGTAARSSAIPSPVHGQWSFRTDDDVLEYYDGSAWTEFSTGLPWATGSGGSESDITVSGESYRLHAFTSNGTFTVATDGLVELALVSGGGSGGARNVGNRAQGGGGGGGILEQTVFLTAGSYSVVIGGGAAGVSSDNPGNIGSASSLGTIEVSGGGGGYSTVAPGVAGATGGGGANSDLPTGQNGSKPVGFPGGNGHNVAGDNSGAGGGGGAREAGSNGTNSVGGDGGDGGDLSAFLGQSAGTTYKGGGGGGQRRSGSPGAGGLGGGTAGGTTGTSSSASANTGGGSGGAATSSGNGGSGIVYVRYKQ